MQFISNRWPVVSRIKNEIQFETEQNPQSSLYSRQTTKRMQYYRPRFNATTGL